MPAIVTRQFNTQELSRVTGMRSCMDYCELLGEAGSRFGIERVTRIKPPALSEAANRLAKVFKLLR